MSWAKDCPIHTPLRAYIVCTTPRSGSTLLCGLLAATGVAGNPGSHFHRPSLDAWLGAHDLGGCRFALSGAAVRAVLAVAVERGTAGTGVFGLRMQWGSFRFFLDRLGELHAGQGGDASRIEAAFGPTAFVHLTRPDKLAQAVSHVRAEQSGLWHRRSDGSELERLAPPAEPRYDRGAIARRLAELSAMDAAWRAWFSDEGIEPVRIVYDSLAADPSRALADVLRGLGRDEAAASGIAVPTARLADATTEAWMERYRREPGVHAR